VDAGRILLTRGARSASSILVRFVSNRNLLACRRLRLKTREPGYKPNRMLGQGWDRVKDPVPSDLPHRFPYSEWQR
jgi:hypothetical protein